MSKPIEICGYKFSPPNALTEVQADKWAELQARNKFEDAVKASRALTTEVEKQQVELGAYQKYVEIADKRLEASTEETLDEDIKRSENARSRLAKAAIELGKKSEEMLEKKKPHDFIIESTYLEFAHCITSSVAKKELPEFEVWQKSATPKDYSTALAMINRLYTPYFQKRATKQN